MFSKVPNTLLKVAALCRVFKIGEHHLKKPSLPSILLKKIPLQLLYEDFFAFIKAANL